MFDKLKKSVGLLALCGVVFFAFSSPAAAWECQLPPFRLESFEPWEIENIVPWGPGGAGVLVSGGNDHSYGLYFNISEDLYCSVISSYISQIRILDSCPDGVERELPCVELVEYYTAGDPAVLQNGRCTAWFNVYAVNEYGNYKEIKRYRPVFDCRDLDKLPELGLIPPGRVVLRNFQSTAWNEYYPGPTKKAKDLYPELFQPEK